MTLDPDVFAPMNPDELEPLLVKRQNSGNFDGMVALYEADAIIEYGPGQCAVGHDEIRALFTEYSERKALFSRGEQNPTLIVGELAMTSTKLPDGSVTSELARRQGDGRWRWVIDRFSVG